MKFLSSNPEKAAIRDRDAALLNRDRLAAKLVEAKAAVITTRSAVQNAALTGNDRGLDVAEAAEAAALRREDTIRAAFAESEMLLATLEAQIIATADSKQRVATNAAIHGLVDELVEVYAALDASLGAAVDVTNRAMVVSTEFSGMVGFVTPAQAEIAAAVPFLADILREHGRRVINHEAPAAYPVPQPAFVPTMAVRPVTVPLFAAKAIKWTDADGALRVCGRYHDADLPEATAARALRMKACWPIDHPSRRELKGTWGAVHPDPAQCVDLDVDEVPAGDAAKSEPVQFTRVDRGPSYVLPFVAGGVS